MNQSKSLPTATVYAFEPQEPALQTTVFGSLPTQGVTEGARAMGTTRTPAQRPVHQGSTGRILIITSAPERYAALPGRLEFVALELSEICAAAAHGDDIEAIVSEVISPDGRELGYRVAHLLRSQFMLSCPIYLVAECTSPSARAYAIQCGATKLMRDDEHLVDDLMRFGLAATTSVGPQ